MTTLIPKFDLMDGGFTPTGAVNRTINLKLSDMVSVKDFGATGNGTTDDTAAIQAAWNSGLPIYHPAGNYVISSALTLGGTVSQLKFDSGATFKTTATFAFGTLSNDQYVINITSTSSFNIDGLNLNCSVFPSNYADGILVSTNAIGNLNNLNFVTVQGWGVVVLSLNAGTKVTNSYFSDCGYVNGANIRGSILSYGNYTNVNQCTVLNSKAKGIAIGGIGSSATNNIVNGTIDNSGTGIYVLDMAVIGPSYQTQSVKIVGNTINNCKENAIKVTQNVIDFIVANNTIVHTTTFGTTSAIFCYGSSYGAVTGNQIRITSTNGQPGIVTQYDSVNTINPSNITITANEIHSATTVSNYSSGVEYNCGILLLGNVPGNTTYAITITGNCVNNTRVSIAIYTAINAIINSNTISTYQGMIVSNGEGVIGNNDIYSSAEGIVLNGTNSINIIGNRINYSLTTAAIGVSITTTTSNNLIISNNYIFGKVQNSSTSAGISTTGSGTTKNVIISSNILGFSTGSPYYFGILAGGILNGTLNSNVVQTGATGTTSISGSVNTTEINTISYA